MKKVWTKTTKEFRVKWTDRNNLGLAEVVDMISDLLAILENLDNK